MTGTKSLIRPAWTPVTIAMMIIGFMIYWPLGLAMIAYILWGDRLDDFKSGVERATDSVSDTFSRSKPRPNYGRTGNVAFDDWHEEELQRLKEERRKLDATIAEFEEHKREARRTQDSKEFDDFMKTRERKPAPRSKRASDKKS
jgi:hypothetical protein